MAQKVEPNCDEKRHPYDEVFIRADSHFECAECGEDWHFDETEHVQVDEDGNVHSAEDDN